jgi:hypothetical protein
VWALLLPSAAEAREVGGHLEAVTGRALVAIDHRGDALIAPSEAPSLSVAGGLAKHAGWLHSVTGLLVYFRK